MKFRSLSLLAGLTLLSAPGASKATDVSAENLTVASSAFLGGVTSFGYSDAGATGTAFTMDVFSGISTIQHEIIIPAHYESQTVFEQVWGLVPGTPESVWVEDYGPTIDEVWVQDFGYTGEMVNVDDYGPVETVTWVPDQFDNEGNLVEAAHYVSTWANGVIGSHLEPVWGVTGGHYEEVPGWGIIGGHYESVPGPMVQAVVDTIQHVEEVWVPEQDNSYTETVTGVPIIRQIGKTADSVWKWKNLERELMEVSPAGLSIPAQGDPGGASRAVLTATMLEQSYTSPATATEYLSYGVKVQKDGVEAWEEMGTAAGSGVQVSQTLKMRPDEVLLREETPIGGTNSVSTRTTRVGVNSSRFGGLVEVVGDVRVQGALRVMPRGDLSMGAFTSGPQP